MSSRTRRSGRRISSSGPHPAKTPNRFAWSHWNFVQGAWCGCGRTSSPRPPYGTGHDTLFVAYYASAEIGCHLAVGWPVPERILDLFTEFRNAANGLTPPSGFGLISALVYHGLDAIGTAEKDEMRELTLRGGPWTSEERDALLDYCESDVLALARLLPAMLPKIDIPRAVYRGRYMAAAARIERAGVPIDIPRRWSA